MKSLLVRAIVGTLAGALLGVTALVALYGRNAAFVMEMDRRAPIAGLYDPERLGAETWAWSGRDATLALPGVDRRIAWSCAIRLRGARADVSSLPQVIASVDGVIAATEQTTNEYRDVVVGLPPRSLPGGTVTVRSSETVEPGGQDRRALGVMIDRWSCAPEAGRPRPPRQGLIAAAAGGATFGLALALAGLSLGLILATTGVVAIGQAIPLTWHYGMFTPYVDRVAWLAVGIAGVAAASVRGVAWVRGSCHQTSRFVVAFTAAVLYLKLLMLLHPAKPPVDVLFHAHRLDWVLAGRYFFTQPMPSGVQFPYAIGLYVFAMPWTVFTKDHVLLLRIIVSTAEAAGALLVYLAVARGWNDRLAGAVAALLFAVVPREFEIVGNANLTNAFGQSVALAVVVAAVQWRLGRRDRWQIGAFFVLTTFALLCHVSTFSLLSSVLVCLAGLYWWRRDPDLRPAAVSTLASLAGAVVASVVVYYAHFADAFRSAAKVRTSAVAAGTAASEASVAVSAKALEAARLTVAAVGWPILLLAAGGAIIWWRRGLRDRLSLAIAAWGITFLAFVVAVVLMPVGASFVRYAAEFISRVTLATYPAVVILAGLGAAAAIRGGRLVGRAVAGVLVTAALYNGAQLWLEWLR